MKLLSGKEVAEKLGITVRRVQQMCKNGQLSGAIKIGNSWAIPEKNIQEVSDKKWDTRKKPLPVGISDYKVASTEYYYVDKTLMIRDFLDTRHMVSLFTRPRRFGKTLNMDMLRVFFEKTEEDTSIYFKDKLIWKCGKEYTDYQGRYPVIYLTFKDIKCTSWEETFRQIKELITIEYQRHMELENSDKLNIYEKEKFKKIVKGDAGNVEYQMSLEFLSRLLAKHHEEKNVIIIDEYDTPIQQGHVCGFYPDVVNFMRNLFSGGLKDNPSLAFGFMTGILRVAKESIFSGLNNITIHSILDKKYSQYFGFTKEEVLEMLEYYHVGNKYDEVCEWYDGYLFGDREIFNPWSVINYIDNSCFPKAFWLSTGSNDIVGEIIACATPEIQEDLHKLMRGQNITTFVDACVIYPEVQNNPYSIFSFLLVAGYLRVSEIYPQHDGNFMCKVGIPNKEISYVYEKEVLNKTNQNITAISISQAIFSGDTEKLQKQLDKFMIESISSFDTVNEGFYHGMMLGLCAVLSNRYQVRSNRESGLGRFDIMLIPRIKDIPAFIYEFKYTKDEKADLEVLADKALKQIDVKKYETELIDLDVKEIIKIGIAFRGKSAIVRK